MEDRDLSSLRVSVVLGSPQRANTVPGDGEEINALVAQFVSSITEFCPSFPSKFCAQLEVGLLATEGEPENLVPFLLGEDVNSKATVLLRSLQQQRSNLTIEQEMSVWNLSSELARLRLNSSHVQESIDVDMKEVQSGTKTCKRCKGSFATESNSSSACRFHPTYFVSRRHDDQKRYYELGPDDPPYAAKFWDCCGSEDPEAEGCKTSFHVSYDEG